MSEANAESIDLAIELAIGTIIEMHMDLDRAAQDADGAMDVLHKLRIAQIHIQAASCGAVQP